MTRTKPGAELRTPFTTLIVVAEWAATPLTVRPVQTQEHAA